MTGRSLFWYFTSLQYEINNLQLSNHPVPPLVGPQPPLVQESQCCQRLVAALPEKVDN